MMLYLFCMDFSGNILRVIYKLAPNNSSDIKLFSEINITSSILQFTLFGFAQIFINGSMKN